MVEQIVDPPAGGKPSEAESKGDTKLEQKDETKPEQKSEKRSPKWASQLSPQIRDKYADSLDAYADKTLNDVFEELETHKAQLSKAIPIPAKDASDEEKKAFLKAMGIPEKPEDYTLKADKLEENNTFLVEFKKHAHAMGLNNTQAQKQLDYVLGIAQAAEEAQKEARANLEKTFAANMTKLAGDKAEEVVNLAKKHLMRYAEDKEILEAFKAANLDVNPRFLNRIAQFEKTLSDTTFIPGGSKPQTDKKGEFGANYDQRFMDMYGGK